MDFAENMNFAEGIGKPGVLGSGFLRSLTLLAKPENKSFVPEPEATKGDGNRSLAHGLEPPENGLRCATWVALGCALGGGICAQPILSGEPRERLS
jgi:hypothetical protein